MGRSKFPGKPSKSINRKRISVLQLDDEKANATATEKTTATNATTNNKSKEKDDLTTATTATSTSTSAAADHHSNDKHHHGSDDDDGGSACGGGGGGGGTASASGSGKSTVASGNGNSSGSGQTNGSNKNGQTTNGNAKTNGAKNASSNAMECSTSSAKQQPAATIATNSKEMPSKAKKTGSRATESSETTAAIEPEPATANDADANEDASQPLADTDYIDNDDNVAIKMNDIKQQTSSNNNQNMSNTKSDLSNASGGNNRSSTSSGSNVTRTSSTSSTSIAANKRGKKFKNLNLNKAEVMLPSTTKLAQQQQTAAAAAEQLNCPAVATTTLQAGEETTEMSATTSSANTTNELNAATTTTTTSLPLASSAMTTEAAATATATQEPIAAAEHNNNKGNVGKLNENENDNAADCNAANNVDSDATTAAMGQQQQQQTQQQTANVMAATQQDDASSLAEKSTSPAPSPLPVPVTSDSLETKMELTNDTEAAAASNTAQNEAVTAANASTTTTTTTPIGSQSPSTSSTASASAKQKKSVTFKNILETSDDKSAIKKFYNPDNRIPLVSIMKKECMNRPMMYSRHNDCIVRPSRLTEILKNNSNIDKTNALKFRTAKLESEAGDDDMDVDEECGSGGFDDDEEDDEYEEDKATTAAVFGASLARAFGAPTADEVEQQEALVSFRLAGDHQASTTLTTKKESEEHTKLEQQHDSDQQAGGGDDDEQQMIVDKHFVLPKRSTRSSRVIKPNKRLLEEGVICKKSIIKKPGVKESQSTTTIATPSLTQSSLGAFSLGGESGKREQPNYFGLGRYEECKETSSGIGSATAGGLGAATSENKLSFSTVPSAFNSFASVKSNSFVLRQSRLQFGSLNERSISSSSNTTTTSSTTSCTPLNNPLSKTFQQFGSSSLLVASSKFGLSPSNLNGLDTPLGISIANAATSFLAACDVCGTPIASKNMQQARKYGSLACEACRKFISKITKKSIAAGTSSALRHIQLQCKNDAVASCSIQPHAKDHLKNFKKIYKERCLACWLKKCIQTFQFPTSLKLRLSALLPDSILKQVELTRQRALDCLEKSELQLRKEAELLSPTGLFGVSRLSTQTPQFKWNATGSDAIVDSLKLALKSNPLADNNTTFGSSSLIKPAVLEKPMFLKSTTSATSTVAVSDIFEKREEPSAEKSNVNNKLSVPNEKLQEESQQKLTKTRRKDKQEKSAQLARDKDDKEKEKCEKPATISTELAIDCAVASSVLAAPILNHTPNPALTSPIAAANTGNATLESSLSPSTSSNVPSTSTTAPPASPTANNTAPLPALSPNSAAAAAAASGDAQKRQRIDLKGPRVKHVCRSASIVLGQPLATFGEEDVSIDGEALTTAEQTAESNAAVSPTKVASTAPAKAEDIVIDENDNCSSCKQETQSNENAEKPKVKAAEQQEAEAGIIAATSSAASSQSETDEPPAKKPVKPAAVAASQDIKQNAVPTMAAVADAVKEKDKEKTKLALQPLKVSTRNNSNSNTLFAARQPTTNSSNSSTSSISHSTTFSKKYMRQLQHNPSNELSQNQQRRKQPAAKTLISIDFWENYDPAEVCQTGFGLIVTETVAQRALCFLCGSTGLDPLIFCACCCEPYHQYCVLDEYNLKHSSLDDTMVSLLDATLANATGGGGAELTQMQQRLNWLCPRCTVCYTCNMSSGSKVKCQKCQKNYHSTCLGTSKRLLGADRPLICVNCLKCKSCSTTKVSKFVGNLPMCATCFKLRKKGNFCPICQKCYDDNDFDLKMMECGDCQRWVHSKCEGLSDEQYNLLSTLPECIEFICKKCARRNENSKQKAQEWRQAVIEEFKQSLMSVLKLLSKSRQACALLKVSPRKKMRCTCSGISGNKMQPKALQFNSIGDSLGSDGESQCSDDVYEFKDRLASDDLLLKPKKFPQQSCACMQSGSYYNGQSNSSLGLVDIKKKIANSEYVSLAEFNYDMNNVIQQANCDDLILAYKELLSEQFPWFQNETKACTDALEEDMFESCAAYGISNTLDTAQPEYQQDDELNERSSVLDLPEDIDDVIYSLKSRVDARTCLFCRKTGEGMPNEESRLLYCGHDCWVHTNCAMWSAEVFEEIDGSLQNVHSAVSRGRMIKCTVCGNRGATVGCNIKSCGEHYHFPCARTISCAFLTDKTMYCPEHAKLSTKNLTASVTLETNFEVTRPVYVELDRKRKKAVEASKVQFHIGSLEVKQLGTIFPRFSDAFEALVPINYLCSRLYWSIKEPWKIVEYTVRTSVQNNYTTLTTMDAGRNFTVDHTNPNASLVQLGLAQITRWHSSLARGELMDLDCNLGKLLPEYMTHNQNSSSDGDENNEEEPQTNADLLPPEIKDVIFEDLRHELLDGISMLDIFPKSMTFEELGNVELGRAELFMGEQSKDGVSSSTTSTSVQISDEETLNSNFGKQLELSSSWPSNQSNQAATINHVEDAMLSAARSNSQAKQRLVASQLNKAELFKKAGSQQRAWAKLESSNAAAALKKRKLNKANLPENVFVSLNQQRAKTDTKAATTVATSNELTTVRTKTFTWSAAKRYIEPSSAVATASATNKDEPKVKLMQVDGVDDSITEFRIISADGQFNGTVKCERCQCTYRTYDSFQRHLATCEPMSSTSESESDTNSRTPETSSPLQATLHDINELNKRQTLGNNNQSLPYVQTFQQGIPIGNIQTNLNGISIAGLQGIQGVQGLQNIQTLSNLQGLQGLQLPTIQSQGLGGSFFISPATTVNSTDDLSYLTNSLQGLTANFNGGTYTLAPQTSYVQQPQQTQQAQLIAVSTNADGTQQIIQLPTTQSQQSLQFQQQQQNLNNAAAFQTLQATNSDKKILLPVGGNNKSMKGMATKAAQQAAAKQKMKAGNKNNVQPIQSKIIAPNSNGVNLTQQQPITVLSTGGTNQLLGQNFLQQMQQQQQPQLLFQTTNAQPQQQPIIMQGLAGSGQNGMAQNILTFVTNDGSANGQLQYVTLPAAQEYKPAQQQATPYLTTAGGNANALLQGGAFLQTDASGNLVLTTAPQAPAGLQMLNLGQTAGGQPQVIGTLVQPQALQLGGNVIATTGGDPNQPQVIIGGNGTTGLEMLAAANAAQQPQLVLSAQPMFYGLETIVQNTVMSSQQFVSTAMPGVLSQNASFSATTTQVFQASKIEPIVDLPAGYVVLNNVDGSQTSGSGNSSFLNATNAVMQAQQQQADTTPSNNVEYRITTNADGTASVVASTANSYQLSSQQTNTQPQQQFVTQTTNSNNNVQIVTAKVPPQVAPLKRQVKTNASTVSKVQPQQTTVNKVGPTNVSPSQQQQQQQMKSNANAKQQHNNALQQLQQQNVYVTTIEAPCSSSSSSYTNNNNSAVYKNASPQTVYVTAAQTATITTPTVATAKPIQQNANGTGAAPKKTIVRPINKVEVKPKVVKTKANVQQQQQQMQSNNQLQNSQLPQQLQNIPNTITVSLLKPQQQNVQQLQQQTIQQAFAQQTEQQNQHQSQQQQYCAHTNEQAHVEQQQLQTMQQDHSQQQQQQYHLGSCQFANADYNQQQHQQQSQYIYDLQTQELTTTNQDDMINNATANNTRVQYTATAYGNSVPTNIVNPLQSNSTQYVATSSSTTTASINSRPTNRVLPMQQRQEPHQQATVTTPATVTPVPSIKYTDTTKHVIQCNQQLSPMSGGVGGMSPGDLLGAGGSSPKCQFNSTKAAYEAEVKQILDSPQHQLQLHDHQLMEQDEPLIIHHQQLEHSLHHQNMITNNNNNNKSELDTMDVSDDALEIVTNDLQEYDNNSKLLNESPLYAQLSDYDATQNPSSLIGECNDDDDDDDDCDFDDRLEDDEDYEDDLDTDDAFSMKMPTEDGDNELSETDEPAVQEKISKILDNLTNEDCADSVTTATTVEATAELNINLRRRAFMNTAQDGNMLENVLTPEELPQYDTDTKMDDTYEAAAAAATASDAEEEAAVAAANEFMSQIDTQDLEPQLGDTQLDVFDLKPKSVTPILPETPESLSTATRSNTQSSQASASNSGISEKTAMNGTMATRAPPADPPAPMRDPKKVSGPHLLYEIQSEDGFTYKSTSITEIWEKVFEAVQVARRAHGLAPLPEGPLADMSGVQMIGLKTNALKYLIEQLPGVERCSKYTPKYHERGSNACLGAGNLKANGGTTASSNASALGADSNTMLDYCSDHEDLQECPYDCARCEPYSTRSEYDMFSWLASRHRKQPIQVFVQPPDNELIPRRGTGSNLPMAMKYRTLKETYKDYVGVFRSHIHGRGLYCTKDIEAGEMVIEYAGELIRSTLTDKRERNYDSRGIGCYMFKIDDNLVVDATMRGNAARFINHSCEPNCYSKVVDILGHKHIIIFALRRIVQGEELTYDYKFPFEDEKIPCSCGSKKCRKYLN